MLTLSKAERLLEESLKFASIAEERSTQLVACEWHKWARAFRSRAESLRKMLPRLKIAARMAELSTRSPEKTRIVMIAPDAEEPFA
jgi:hypothetical protein